METVEKQKTFSEVVRSEILVLVEFTAEWCGPCKIMTPILQEVKQQLGESIKILTVDIDKNPTVSQEYRVLSVPTLLLYRKGEIVWRQAGVISVPALMEIIREKKGK